MFKSTEEWGKGVPVENPGRFSALAVWVARYLIWPLVRVLFRPRLYGIENLPQRGPFLLVANHSAGAGIAEILSLVALYVRDVGPDRPLAGFALPQGFHVFPLSFLLRAIGAIPSTYAAAEETLGKGVPILVFPGGDHETLRPVWRANQADFGGRKGFLKVARNAGVPIVPLGIQGAHYTCPIFLRAGWLAWVLLVPRLIGLKRWGISLPGLLGAAAILAWVPWAIEWRALLVWLWLGSPLVFLPIIPWRINMRIGTPFQLEALDAKDDLDEVGQLHSVERCIEALLAAPKA